MTLIRLRDVDNRDDQNRPFVLRGSADDVIAYLEGPVRSDTRTRAGKHAIENGVAAIRRGDLQRANKHLRIVSIDVSDD